jgi:hypothetical protein
MKVGSTMRPRVLLADEVRLNKPIKAGMIIHKQLLAVERAARVLIVVPETPYSTDD